jgi:hypothetical protein
MSRRSTQASHNRTPAMNRGVGVVPSRSRLAGTAGKRARGAGGRQRTRYLPPENWHEPRLNAANYRVIAQSAGIGYRHVLTAADVRARLAQLPSWMTTDLEVVQISRMTRKKQTFPCYGMQWGNAIYLYPVEEDRIEHFAAPPKPAQIIEARMYGAEWKQCQNSWELHWTEASLRDFYLNNILIHELGHLLDQRNASYIDRERYAEWFALEHGYKPSRKAMAQAAALAFAPSE